MPNKRKTKGVPDLTTRGGLQKRVAKAKARVRKKDARARILPI